MEFKYAYFHVLVGKIAEGINRNIMEFKSRYVSYKDNRKVRINRNIMEFKYNNL